MHSTFKTKRTLADAIVRAILAEPERQPGAQECFACGRAYRGRSRFCSDNCIAAFDAGVRYDPDYASKNNPIWYSLPIGQHGFLIECAGCKKSFDSRGLRCCSVDCERDYRRKQELEAELADDPFRVVKRTCAECGRDLPNWRNGRRVSTATKFCSDKCRKSAGRRGSDQNPVLSGETAKKCPENGGSHKVVSQPTSAAEGRFADFPVISRWEPCPNPDPDFPEIPEFLRRVLP